MRVCFQRYLCSFDDIVGHERSLRPRLLQIMHDVQGLDESVPVYLQSGDVLHRIDLPVLIAVLLSSRFYQRHRFYVVRDLF